MSVVVTTDAASGTFMIDGYGRVRPRERDVLALTAEGFSVQQIAKEMYITEKTVKTHRYNAVCRLQARNTLHAVVILLRRGEIA